MLINDSFLQTYYDANTDRNDKSNRLSAIQHIINDVDLSNPKNRFFVRRIRYAGGYYATYLFSMSSIQDLDILEYSKHLGRIRIYGYTASSGKLEQYVEL